MSEPLRFAVLGAGAISQTWGQAFLGSSSGELVAVADVRREAAEAFAERFRCRAFGHHEALLREAQPDVMVICTPPATHEALAGDAVSEGAHVICEKPLAPSVDAARRMIERAEEAGVTLTMASKFRYVADMVAAKSLVASGVIGDLLLCENVFTGRVDMSQRWNSDPAIAGGGVLIDNGTHSCDVMRYLLGPLAEVQAVEGARAADMRVEDTVHLFLRSESGARGRVDLSWRIHKPLSWFVCLYGTDGMIEVGWGTSRAKTFKEGTWKHLGDGYDKVQAFRSQIDNVVAALRGEEALLIDAADALASVAAIEAAYASLRAERWTSIDVEDL